MKLPDSVLVQLWDYGEGLEWDRDRSTVIWRVLQAGGKEAIRWLLEHSSREELRELLIRREGRGLSPRRLRFWGLILDIPTHMVDEWVTAARSQPWYRRTSRSIQLGHRRSLDFDWFTGSEIADPHALAAELRGGGLPFEVEDVAAGTLHGMLDGVRVSFLEYRYPLLSPTRDWTEYGCQLASLEDLAGMKLSAIASRGAKKDFVDIFALGRRVFTLPPMVDLYRRKFEVADIGHVILSLTYFDDADPEAMPEMLWDTSWDEVKTTIESWVRAYMG